MRTSLTSDLSTKASIGVVIVGAGTSQRMGGEDKVFANLHGRPLIAHSVEVFNSCPKVDAVVLVFSPHRIQDGRNLVTEHGFQKVTDVCQGGQRRQDSVRVGLDHLSQCGWAIVHDAARPLVDDSILYRGLDAAVDTGAATAAVPAKDTIKLISENNIVKETLPRDQLWHIQTPQIFRYDLLMEAHRQCKGDYTDDSAMVESLGVPVKVFWGSYDNIKVTTPEDLLFAETLVGLAKSGRA